MEAAVWHRESHGRLLCPYIFTCVGSSQRFMGFVRGPWSRLHYKHWGLTGTLPGHPVAALDHGAVRDKWKGHYELDSCMKNDRQQGRTSKWTGQADNTDKVGSGGDGSS